ncbi:MAG: succinylglutamate desuccinylase/aspartoacylase family protein [Phaeodactylibacter sp.]|nr:succinylglutamate desuccinylase/aspartoacylase family protein [Phaeodactylibacter sp.]MCB9273243.1 succinylglutamate desuccinylase/aspartoacylase family protein [Lewinellaceae bacterium]
MTQKPFLIHNAEIMPGSHEVVRIPVGWLPSGNVMSIRAHVYRSLEPGPVLLAVAGIHGDEVNGVEIIRRAVTQGLFEGLARGSVIAIPILNVYGFINYSREVPDGKDVNRSFPGNMKGSLASRVARTLTKKILPYADFAVDFHTGGNGTYNYPQIRYSRGDKRAEQMAHVFAPPFVVAKPLIAKSFRKAATDQGKMALVFEGGENLRYDALSIEAGLAGLHRLMYAQNMTEKAPPQPGRCLSLHKASWLRAPRAGMFLWYKCSGDEVRKGETLGVINDPYGEWEKTITAPRDGYLIGHNNAPVVSQGDALFHLGA